MSRQTLKVGVVQQSVANSDKQLNWQRSAHQIKLLAGQGCELVMLQELHSTLYFYDFGTFGRVKTPQNQHDLSLETPGHSTQIKKHMGTSWKQYYL